MFSISKSSMKPIPRPNAPIEQLIAYVDASVAVCGTAGQIHFVSHSMGGVLVRAWLTQSRPARLGRIVMLGPPMGSSGGYDSATFRIFEFFDGPAQTSARRDPDGFPDAWARRFRARRGRRDRRPIDPVGMFDQADDGKVSVEEHGGSKASTIISCDQPSS